MRSQPVIQKCIALVLLLLFMLSSAPRAFIHDLIADHKDLPSCKESHHSSTVLHKQSQDCHCDHLVVTSPYEPASSQINITAQVQFREIIFSPFSILFQQTVQYKESRGPPAA